MSVVESVRGLAEPIAASLELVLWDVRFFKEGADWILLITIDKEDGLISINDCEAMSRAIDPVLDEADVIPQSYRLQVSSPGLERKLRTAEHLQAFLGEKIMVRLQKAYEGQREYKGILADFDGTAFTLELPDGRGMGCTLGETAWVKADDFDD